MGAHVWQRERSAGRAFVVGAQQAAKAGAEPRGGRHGGRHGGGDAAAGRKRKLVWSRAGASTPAKQSAADAQVPPQHANGASAARDGLNGAVSGAARPNSTAGAATPAAAPGHTTAAWQAAKRPRTQGPPAVAPAQHAPTAAGSAAAGSSDAAAPAAAATATHGRRYTNGSATAAAVHSLSASAAEFRPPGDHRGSSNANASASAAADDAGPAAADLDAATAAEREAARRAAARALAAKQAELAQLRRAMQQQQRRLAADQAAATAAEVAAARATQEAAAQGERRRQRLEAGFARAFQDAQGAAAAEAAAPKAAAPAADAAEISRVLAAKSDYEILRLPAGAGRDDIRARYRDMAKALHPDKCGLPRATDAFHRLFEAYTNLRGFVG